MVTRQTRVVVDTGELPSARGVEERDLIRVIGRWQSIAHGSFRQDCRWLKQMIAETDELRLWEKNIGGFTYTDRDTFLREKVLIDYELTESDMTEILAMLKRDDLDKVRDCLNDKAAKAQTVEAKDKANPSRQGQRIDFVDTPERDINEVGRPAGTAAAYAHRRLRKDRPDLHARVLSGEISPHAAMIQAGFRKRAKSRALTALDQILKLIPKLSPDEARVVAAKASEKALSPSDTAAIAPQPAVVEDGLAIVRGWAEQWAEDHEPMGERARIWD